MANKLPTALVVLWTFFLAVVIWSRIPAMPQPPIYDTFSYYWKAYDFWSAFRDGRWFNPLNVEPSSRPPGTVLMSYPFGFEENPRGFYFRSIFLPAALMVLSALIAAYRPSPSKAECWRAAALAVLSSTPSLFYRFDLGPQDPFVSYWGLVDGFLSGVAALSAACAWQSARRNSIRWACATAATSALCILIKPSGVLVAMLIGVFWCVLALAQTAVEGSTSSRRRRMLTRHIAGGMIIAAVELLVLAAALSSDYLSKDNLASGLASIAVMKAEQAVPFSAIWPLIHFGPGDGFLLIILLGVLIPVTSLLRARQSPKSDRHGDSWLALAAVLGALAALALGLWFWLYGSGGQSQVRYGMPFFAIAMIWMLPAISSFWARAPRLVTSGAMLVMVAIPLNLALLLVQVHPPREWQRAAGFALDLGSTFTPLADFQRFIEEPRPAATTIYSFDTDEADQIMDSLALQHRLFHPDLEPVNFYRPIDWQRPTTYRIDEMLSSDFFLFRPRPSGPVPSSGLSFPEERKLFQWWASQLGSQDGVEIRMDFPSARLLRIVDRSRLRQSLLRMVSAHSWRPTFNDANATSLWFSKADMDMDSANSAVLLQDIRFADLFELVRLLSEANGEGVRLKLWWRPLRGSVGDEWAFFVHEIDADGKIVQASELKIRPLEPDPAPQRNLRLAVDELTLRGQSRRLAVGFYRKDEMLHANSGSRDWDGRRVLVSLP